MKTQVKSRSIYFTLFLLMCLSLGFITRAEACHKRCSYYQPSVKCCKKMHAPVAICTTSGTNIQLPPYVCCGFVNKHGHVVGHRWVAGSCRNAPMAYRAMGCSIHTKVYGTHAPIIGDCQFSHSTRSCY